MSLPIVFGILFLIIVAFALLYILPATQHASGWGNDPSGGVGLVLAVMAVLLLLARI